MFLHGANGGGRFLPFMEKLAAHFEVIAPEHPGFGKSDSPAWLDNVQDLGHFYASFLEQLGLSDVTLVGTSLGGWIAAETALRAPSRLRALTHKFRDGMGSLGFTLAGDRDHPIVPVMLGDAVLAQKFAARLLELGVYAVGFFYPVVPKDKARIRTQMNAALTREDLDKGLAAFAQAKKELMP